jgi:hypothetical protein
MASSTAKSIICAEALAPFHGAVKNYRLCGLYISKIGTMFFLQIGTPPTSFSHQRNHPSLDFYLPHYGIMVQCTVAQRHGVRRKGVQYAINNGIFAAWQAAKLTGCPTPPRFPHRRAQFQHFHISTLAQHQWPRLSKSERYNHKRCCYYTIRPGVEYRGTTSGPQEYVGSGEEPGTGLV